MRTLFHYELYDLRVASELFLPGVPEAGSAPGADVHIRVENCGEAPHFYSFGALPGGGFYIDIPEVGAFRVRPGEIRVSRPDAIPDDQTRVWLLGSAMGALLHQRGALPLHASAVAVDSECHAFVGPQGAGKSTLCAFLAERGHLAASDDVLAVLPKPSAFIQVASRCSSLRLTSQTVEALRGTTQSGNPAGRRAKQLLQVASAPSGIHALRAIYVLQEGLPKGAVDLVELSGADALQAVFSNVYRPQFLREIGSLERAFAMSADVVRRVPVFRLIRPKSFRRMRDVVERLENFWAKELGISPPAGEAR